MSAAGNAGAAGDNSGAAGAAGAGDAAPWYATRNDNEFAGTLQNRGLDKKGPDEAAHEFYKAHREATQMISRLTGTGDKDRILVMPKPDASEEEKSAFWGKLGRPAAKDQYDFKTIKFENGDELDDEFVGVIRDAAFESNLSKEGAAAFAKRLTAYLSKAEGAEAASIAAKRASEAGELRKEVGQNWEAFQFVASQGAAKLGWTPKEVEALQNAVGYKAVMVAAHKAGIAFGEDKFVANSAPGMNGVMTREQAAARMAENRQDKEWVSRFQKGDRRTLEEFNALTAMMTEAAE